MADRSKKQLIYKDYSAVNTNGSSLNVDLTENSSLLGGEIWYNWQTATSVLMRAKGITTSRHHSRFFWLDELNEHIFLTMSLASTLQGMKRMRWDGNDFLTITYRQHRDSRKRFRFFDVQPILFELLHFLRFYRYKRCNHTWWEVVSRRQQKSGVTKHFSFQRNWEGFVYRSFWPGVWFPLNKRSCDPPPFNVPWNIGKRKGVIRFNPIALRCPHRLFIHWKTVTNE